MAAVEWTGPVGTGREPMMAARDRARAERLKAQLRANLKRRKEQARARARMGTAQQSARDTREGDATPAAGAGSPHSAAARPEQGGDA